MELYKKRISDLGRIVTGKTPKTSISQNYGGKIPFLTPSDDLSGKFAPKTIKTITETGLSEVKNCLLPTKSVCVSCIGSDLGKVVITKEPTVTNQQFNSIIPNEYYDTDFIYYLMTIVGKQLNFLSKTSTAVPIINKSTFADYKIEIPSLEHQRQMSQVLSSLDDKIEVNRRINDNLPTKAFIEVLLIWILTSLKNDNLEQQAQALFKSWFVDFEPFRDQPFVESEMGMIPQGWRVGNVYANINVIYGAPYKSSLFNSEGKGHPLIRIRDLKTYAPQFYTEEIMPNTEYVKYGDVVAGMDAEFCPVFWKGETGVLNQRVCKFVPKSDDVSNVYVLHILKPELEFVQSYKTGTTVSHLGKSDIDRFRVIIPPIEILRKFSTITGPMLKEIIKVAKESSRLASLRDTLLPKLMSGELKVNEIENSI